MLNAHESQDRKWPMPAEVLRRSPYRASGPIPGPCGRPWPPRRAQCMCPKTLRVADLWRTPPWRNHWRNHSRNSKQDPWEKCWRNPCRNPHSANCNCAPCSGRAAAGGAHPSACCRPPDSSESDGADGSTTGVAQIWGGGGQIRCNLDLQLQRHQRLAVDRLLLAIVATAGGLSLRKFGSLQCSTEVKHTPRAEARYSSTAPKFLRLTSLWPDVPQFRPKRASFGLTLARV